MLVGLVTCLVIALKTSQQFSGDLSSPKVTGHTPRDAYLAESARFLDAFDGTAPDLSEGHSGLREALESLAACSAQQDQEAFDELVDFERVRGRVRLLAEGDQLNVFERSNLRHWANASIEVEPYWCDPIVVGVVQPSDEPETRIVYVVSTYANGGETAECRLLFARHGDAWRLYDWGRLDLGIMESKLTYLRYRDANHTRADRFSSWADEIIAADAAVEEGDDERPRLALQRAERSIPRGELRDYCLLLTAYNWQSAGSEEDALRCFREIKKPALSPGTYYGIGNCLRESEPETALEQYGAYVATLGPSPEVVQIQAELHEELGNTAAAETSWRTVLRVRPGNLRALSKMLKAFPTDRKADIVPLLQRTEAPTKVAGNLVAWVEYEDYEAVRTLVDYLEETAPQAAATYGASGTLLSLDGRYPEATAAFLEAVKRSSEEESHTWELLSAAVEAGTIVETIALIPDQDDAFESLFYGEEDGEFQLTNEEYESLVRRRFETATDDTDALCRWATLLVEGGRASEAESLLNQALAKRPTPLGDEEEPDYERRQILSALSDLYVDGNRYNEAIEAACDNDYLFEWLVQELSEKELPAELASLVKQGTTNGRSKAAISYAEGRLAELRQQPLVAADHYRAADAASEEEGGYQGWKYRAACRAVCLENGDWLAYYEQSSDPVQAFSDLSDEFIEDRDWQRHEALCARHTRGPQGGSEVTLSRVDASWQRDDYADFLRQVEKLTPDAIDELPSYKADRLHDRRIAAHLRRGDYGEAFQIAKERQDDIQTAAIHASVGNIDAAMQAARRHAADGESLSDLYTHSEAGSLFLAAPYTDLVRDHPVSLPYAATATLAVLYTDEPPPELPSQITTSVVDVEGEQQAEAVSLEQGNPNIEAVAFRLRGGAIWLAQGGGVPYDQYEISGRKGPPARWIAIGVSGWTEQRRDELSIEARRLAASLFAGLEGSVRLAGTDGRLDYEGVFPNTETLLTAWREAGGLASFRHQASARREMIDIEYSPNRDRALNRRAFNAGVFRASREFMERAGTKLFVRAELYGSPGLEGPWIEVKEIKRRYGSLQFVGPTQEDSPLLPELRKGLNLEVSQHKLVALRKGADEIIRLGKTRD